MRVVFDRRREGNGEEVRCERRCDQSGRRRKTEICLTKREVQHETLGYVRESGGTINVEHRNRSESGSGSVFSQ